MSSFSFILLLVAATVLLSIAVLKLIDASAPGLSKKRPVQLLRGSITFAVALLVLLIAAACFYPFVLVKLIIPWRPWRSFWTQLLMWIKQFWVGTNRRWFGFMLPTVWDVSLPEGLSRKKSYLVISNHVVGTDIFVAWQVLNRRIPPLRFFIKRSLLYVPIIGWACWAMDFPFMKRYSARYLEKHPEKRGEDFKTTKEKCQRYADMNVAVLNYSDGTRFTEQKRRSLHSPFRHLLRPKAGGTALVLNAMGEHFDAVLDMTLMYVGEPALPSLWDFWCGRIERIIVNVEKLPVTQNLMQGDYSSDNKHREYIQEWITNRWARKDRIISQYYRHYQQRIPDLTDQ